MTVKELIEKLKQVDENKIVLFLDDGMYEVYVEEIEEYENEIVLS